MEGLSKRPGEPDMNDIFAHFFGGGHPMFGFDFGPDEPSSRRGKGANSVIPHEVTLEDLYNGKSVKMNMEKEVICTVCKGYCISETWTRSVMLMVHDSRSGARGNAKPKPCSTCEGAGISHIKTRVRAFLFIIPSLIILSCHREPMAWQGLGVQIAMGLVKG